MIFLDQDDELAPWIYGILHGDSEKDGQVILTMSREER
jgi:hypothetical protein